MRSFVKRSNEVYFFEDPVVGLGEDEIGFLKEKVAHTKDKSIRLCMHKHVEDAVHEMLILHYQEAYIRPHKHPRTSVSYHIIEGEVDMVLFDESGEVADVMAMGDSRSGKPFYFRLDQSCYYLPLVKSEYLLFHEIMKGPFEKSCTVYAPWAAEKGDPEAEEQFRKQLSLKISRFKQLSGRPLESSKS